MAPINKAETVGKEVRAVRPLPRFLLLDVLRDKESRPVFCWRCLTGFGQYAIRFV